MTRPAPRRSRSDEAGSAAVIAVVLSAALLVVALVGSVLGGLVAGQRRAAAAADLAALAGADALTPGVGDPGADPCREAGRISSANGAQVTRCRVEGQELVIDVSVEVPSPWGGSWPVPGSARAGPVRSVGP